MRCPALLVAVQGAGARVGAHHHAAVGVRGVVDAKRCVVVGGEVVGLDVLAADGLGDTFALLADEFARALAKGCRLSLDGGGQMEEGVAK